MKRKCDNTGKHGTHTHRQAPGTHTNCISGLIENQCRKKE